MNGKVLIPISNGSEEMEAVIIIDVLRRAGIDVVVAGEFNQVVCSRNVKIIPDTLLESINEDEIFDAIIVPGGLTGTENLMKSEKLTRLLNNNKNNMKLIGAVCAAPMVITNAGVVPENANITSYPSVQNKFEKFNYVEKSTVIDGNIITSRAAGTCFDFAFEIINLLKSNEIAEKIKKDILYTN